MDVISILKKKRIKIDDFECHLEADRADEHPKVFTNIKLKFKIFGKNISPEAVERGPLNYQKQNIVRPRQCSKNQLI